MVDVTHAADIRAVLGASGTGKSHYVKGEIGKNRRVIVWDMEEEYSDLVAIPLGEIPSTLAGKSFRVRYIPSHEEAKRRMQFDAFCRIILQSMEKIGGTVLVIVEELRFVTSANRSTDAWAGLTVRGRKRGIKIIGTSQRPAQIDKDFLGQCNLIRCGALTYPPDRAAVAGAIDVDVNQLAALEGFQAVIWTRTPKKITFYG